MTRSLSLLAATVTVAAALFAGAHGPRRSRTFQFTYKATVKDLPAGSKALDLWLPYPQSDANQTIHRVTVHAAVPVTIATEPKTGNMMAHFHEDSPRGPLSVEMDVVATRKENAGEKEPLTPVEAAHYLKPEPLVPLDGPVRRLAVEATRGRRGDEQKAHAIYEKVTGMMRYDKTGTGWGRGDAIFACDAKRGNCTDFHALIIGMARSQGIPARFAIGFPLPEKRGEGEVPGYHCWAELYVKGRGWVPVDSSEAARALAEGNPSKKEYFYGHHDENRLEFSRGRNLPLAPAQKAGPLNFFVYPYAEVDGQKYEGVDKKFSYRDFPNAETAMAAR